MFTEKWNVIFYYIWHRFTATVKPVMTLVTLNHKLFACVWLPTVTEKVNFILLEILYVSFYVGFSGKVTSLPVETLCQVLTHVFLVPRTILQWYVVAKSSCYSNSKEPTVRATCLSVSAHWSVIFLVDGLSMKASCRINFFYAIFIVLYLVSHRQCCP